MDRLPIGAFYIQLHIRVGVRPGKFRKRTRDSDKFLGVIGRSSPMVRQQRAGQHQKRDR